MTSLRNNPSDDARDAYLDAARACILDVGWRRTTLTEVARRAGVSRMTIYRSWSDMQTLLGDLMTREWTGVVQAALADQDPARSAVDRLVAGIVGTVRVLRDNELFVRIIELDPELVLPYVLHRRGRSQDLILALTDEAIRAAQASGEVRAGSSVAIARGLLLAAHGFVLSAHTMVDDEVTEPELDAELAALLTRSLAP
ncbi:TetR/AcrR family transcriptional regulator [Nocardioides sp. 503]|uniref:TetR/AcrR family transcriptional regulator n=1 Tax=Nocardioides sp. 503 TaxID=2508326 RepID=UPI0010702F0C|nr:TetR/AcrR family transcriptional regulator [Nocardioides sp. 503]